MHFLLDCTVLMRLVMSFIPKDDIIEWLKETKSEWHSRLMLWQNILCSETFEYACQIGDILKLNKFTTILSFANRKAWHMQTWLFFADHRLKNLQASNTFNLIQDCDLLERIVPFFQLPNAQANIQETSLCTLVGKLTLDVFVKLFKECKVASQRLLCKLVDIDVDVKRSKPTIKWLTEQLGSESCTQLHDTLSEWHFFHTSQFVIVKYLIQTHRIDTDIRHKLFHSHIRQCTVSNPYYQKLILLLWQKTSYLANYMLPFVKPDDETPRSDLWYTANENSQFFALDCEPDDTTHVDSESDKGVDRRKRRRICTLSNKINDTWLRLPEDDDYDLEAEDTDNLNSDPDDFIEYISDSDSEDSSFYVSREFDDSIYNVPQITFIENAQSSLHDVVCNNMTSSIAHEFLSQMSFVGHWTEDRFCTAFANTCKGARLSLACILWNLAPHDLHKSLSQYLPLAFKSDNRKFMQFAWDRAPVILSKYAFEAARIALLYRNSTLWQFLFDQCLLTEDLLFDERHKLWHKLCYAPANFLRLVWKNTLSWCSKFDVMIQTALKANKRWVVLFLSKQNVEMKQSWIRDSIVELTRLNLPRILEKIHEPHTLNLEDVQNSYSCLMNQHCYTINDTWWNMYPLTRDQLLGVPDFNWSGVKPKLMRHLWVNRIVNVDDLCAYARDPRTTNHELHTFDLDQDTVRKLNINID